MESINDYISVLKKEIKKLGGDRLIAEEYESQLIEEYREYKEKYIPGPTSSLEPDFTLKLENPKIVAKSLLGISIEGMILERNASFFTKNQWIRYCQYIFVLHGVWLFFNLFYAISLFIFGYSSIQKFQNDTLPFGWMLVILFYVSPVIFFSFQYADNHGIPAIIKFKYFIVEMFWLIVLAISSHYTVVELHNMVGRLLTDGRGIVPASLGLVEGFQSTATLFHAIRYVIVLYISLYLVWSFLSLFLIKKQLINSVFVSAFPLVMTILSVLAFYTTQNLYLYLY